MLTAAIWNNVLHPTDVNGRNGTSAHDALLVINELQRRSFSDPATGTLQGTIDEGQRPPFYDVNCDTRVSAFDALLIINSIARPGDEPAYTFATGSPFHPDGGVGIAGSITAVGCHPRLSEGDSLRTELSRTVTLTEELRGVRMLFDAPQFDLATTGAMQDAFEVHLTDDDGNLLIAPFEPGRTVAFNWSESSPPAGGTETKFAIPQDPSDEPYGLFFNLSHLDAGTEVTVTARLVNNDSDNQTSVLIRDVGLVAASDEVAPNFAAQRLAPDPGDPVRWDRLKDLTASILPSYGRTSYTADRSQIITELVVTNIGNQTVVGDLLVALDGFSEIDTFVTHPDGLMADGRPYFRLTGFTDAPLEPGRSTRPRVVRFTNPQEQRFDYRLTTFGDLNVAPRAFLSTPEREIEAGRTFRYTAEAIDDDGHQLTYSVVTGPESMMTDGNSGEVAWLTTPADIGSHIVTLRATDPFGLSVEQTFSIEVLESLQNRPPNFVSEPVTDAIASSGFEITTVSTGAGPAGVSVIDGFRGPRLVSINAGEQTLSVRAGKNDDRFDEHKTISSGEPQPTDSLFDVGYGVDIGLPDFVSRSDANEVLGMDQADFNGDGILDLAALTYHLVSFTTHSERYTTITVMQGDGNGGFGEPLEVMKLELPSSADPRNLVAADINGDGAADLLAVDRNTATLYTILGNGDGTFRPAVATLYDDAKLSDFRVVDLDRDGAPDLVGRTAQLGFGANYDLMWMRGVGDGTFSEPIVIDEQAGSAPNCCYTRKTRPYDIADLNGDGHLDIVVAGRGGSNVAIYFSDGQGGFTLEAEIDPPGPAFYYNPDWLSVADFTGDGNLDIAYVYVWESRLDILVGDGSGTNFEHREGVHIYSRSDNWAGSDRPVDIDGDGDLDIVLTSGVELVSPQVLINDGTGNFTRTVYPMADFPGQITEFDPDNFVVSRGAMFGDYNRDGVVDLAYMTGGDDFSGIGIRLGTRPGEFGSTRSIPFTQDRADDEVLVGDLDGDGILDLLSLRSAQTLLGNGDGTFQPSFPGAPMAGSPGLLADLNVDGILDFVATPGNTYRSALGNGDGTFELKEQQFAEGSFYGYAYIDTADFNNDGYPDFIAKASVERHIDVYLNRPEDPGTFERSFRTTTYFTGINVSNFDQAVTIGDFNNDGLIDFVAGDRDENGLAKLMLFVGDGAGGFSLESESFIYDDEILGFNFYYTGDLSSGDLNGDGYRDVVSFTTQGPMIHLGDGSGGFVTTDLYPRERQMGRGRDGHVFDIDEDGHLDLIETGGPAPETLLVRRGRGDGTFDDPLRVGMLGQTTQLAFADIDHDGHTDIISVIGNSGNYNADDAVIYAGKRDGLVDLHAVDLDGDGNQEVVAVNENNDRLKLFLGDNFDNLTRLPDLQTGRAPKAVTSADLDGDGRPELITANRTGASLSVFAGSPATGYQGTEIAFDGRPNDVQAADLDDDGRVDLVALDDENDALWIFAGNGSTAPDAPVAIALGDKPGRMTLADATGDGLIDAVITLPESDRLLVLSDVANRGASEPIYVNLSGAPSDVAVVDFNDDGHPDLVTTLPDMNMVSLYYGRGDGQFARPQQIAVGEAPTRVTLADADEDGHTDLIVANRGDDTLSVIYNRFDPNEVYRYDADAIDPDDDPLQYSVVDGPGGMFVNAETGQVFWAASPDQVGQHPVTLRADDGRGGIGTQTFNIDVRPARENALPLIATEPKAAIGAGEVFEYQATAVDNDGDALRYRLLDGPAGAVLHPTTGKLTWDGTSQAMGFGTNGRSGNIRISPDQSLKPESITVEGWYNLHSLSRFQPLMHDTGRVGYAYLVQTIERDQGLRVDIRFDDNHDRIRFDTPYSVATDRWFHLALTYDASSGIATLYVDGQAIGSGATPNPQPLAFDPDTVTLVANSGGGGGTQAIIDNYRIWNDARSPEEIVEGLRRQYSGHENLVLDYRFEGPNTRSVRDASSYGNDGYRFNNGLMPQLRAGLTDPGEHPFTISVSDGRGGYDRQSFVLEVKPELRGGITGHLFDDLNFDGDHDDGSEEGVSAEPSLEGWHLFIDSNSNGFPDPDEPQAVTDSNGDFAFEGLLPGRYPLRVSPTAGYREPEPFDVEVTAGDHSEIDLAIEQLSLGQIRGQLRTEDEAAIAYWKVYADLDEDGQHDVGEPLATTDRDGRFAVTGLEAGDYTVRPLLPAGWIDTAGKDGLSVTLSSDEILDGNDFVLRPTNSSVTGGVHFVTTPGSAIEAIRTFRYPSVAMSLADEPLVYDLSLAPEGMAVDPATGLVAWRPTIDQVGEQAVVLRATGAVSGSIALQDFTVRVVAPNTAPVLVSPPPSNAYEGRTYAADLRALDAESDAINFTLISGPAAANLDPESGRLRWLPTAGEVGQAEFVIELRDALGASRQVPFTVEVLAETPDSSPFVFATPREGLGLGQTYVAQLQGTDALHRPLSWSLESGPAAMVLGADGSVRWTPSGSDLGRHTVELIASDPDGVSEPFSFELSVVGRPVNTPPTITSEPIVSVVLGDTYRDQVIANDADRDPLAYALIEAPVGMVLDPSSGQLRWTPTAGQLGISDVTIEVTDPDGTSDRQSFELRVSRTGGPPLIGSVPPTEAAVGTGYSYSVQARDAEADPLVYRLLTAPAGMTITGTTGEIAWTPASDQLGTQEVVIEVSDGIGGTATQGFAIRVSDGVPNLPPRITSSAPRFATVGVEYMYAIRAVDPESTALSYSFRRAPDGLQVDPTTGLVTWTPSAAQVGQFVVTLIATDAGDAIAIESFELDVLAENRNPTIDSMAPAEVPAGAEFSYQLLARDADLDPLLYSLTTAPAGASIDGFGKITWATSVPLIGEHDFVVVVSDPRGGQVTQSFALKVVEDTEPPRVSIIESPGDATRNVLPWQGPFTVFVRAIDDVAVASLTLQANGEDITLDASGRARFTFEDWGFAAINATATAVDTNGNVSTKTITFDYDFPEGWGPQNDDAIPTATITSPQDAEAVFGMVSIHGTADHEDFAAYKLAYRRVDELTYTEFLQGDQPVTDGELGVWDTSLLINDEYVIRLEVATTGGVVNVAEHRVGLSGDLKLGNFRLSFSDLVIPVAGIPIEITRIYDTLQSDREGDFGYGWRLEYRDTDLRVGVPNSGLEDIGIYSPLRPGVKVYLNVPGQGRQGFTFDPEIRVLPGFGGENLVLARPRFTPDPGVTSTLSSGTSGYLRLNERGELFAPGNLPYNPASPDFGGAYVLTTEEGVTYRIDGASGKLVSATGTNGYGLRLDDSGIRSDSGIEVEILRDRSGRVVEIIDPAGRPIRYRYSAAGDLAHVTDRRGNRTTFHYSATNPHYLQSVEDPSGEVGNRLEYDEFGRLRSLAPSGDGEYAFRFVPEDGSQAMTAPDGSTTYVFFDDLGNLLSSTNALGHRRDYGYDAKGNVTNRINEVGEQTRFRRAADGRVTSVTDSRGATTRYARDNAGNITGIVLADGSRESYRYDDRGNLLEKTDASGATTRHSYSDRGLRESSTRADGTTVLYTYDDQGLLQTERLPGAYLIHFAHDEMGNIVSQEIRDDLSSELLEHRTWEYDENGNVVEETVGGRTVVSNTFDKNNQLARVVDAFGNETDLSYNSAGTLESARYSDGTERRFGFDENGNITSMLGRGGVLREVVLDAAGRPTEIRRYDTPDGSGDFEVEHELTLDPLGRLVRVLASDKVVQENAYEHSSVDASQVSSELGVPVTKSFDVLGRVSSLGQGPFAETYAYDAAGNLTETRWQDGTSEAFEYDSMHRVVRSVSRTDVETRFEYDSMGNVTKIRRGGATYLNEWNAAGQVTRQLDPDGRETLYRYDSAGNLVEIEEAGETYRLTYDGNGSLAEKTNFRGQTIEYVRDSNGQIIEESVAGETVTAAYFDHGLVKEVTASGKTAQFRYNDQLSLNRYTDPHGHVLEYQYDSNQRLSGYRSGANSVDYQFTDDGKIRQIALNGEAVATYTYDELGRLVEASGGNGLRETRRYDADGRVAEIAVIDDSDSTLLSYQYSWDDGGRIAEVNENGDRVVQFSYDPLGRLVGEMWTEEGQERSVVYQYDLGGNRVAKRDTLEGETTYRYNSRSQLVEAIGPAETTTYSYDADGNLVRETTGSRVTIYEWNARNRLVAVTKSIGGSVTSQTTYEYDQDGNRIAEVVDGHRREFLVDIRADAPRVIAIKNFADAEAGWDFNVFGTRPVVQVSGANTTHFSYDLHSGVRAAFDGNGDQVGAADYDGFGNPVESDGMSSYWPGYKSESADTTTGWINLTHRQYVPAVGRFSQRDPYTPDAHTIESRNRYVYTDNDPVHRSDPSGLNWAHDASTWVVEGILGLLDSLYQLLPHRLVNSRFEDASGNPTSKYTGTANGLAIDAGVGFTALSVRIAGLGKAAGDSEVYSLDAAYTVADLGFGLSFGGGKVSGGGSAVELLLDKTAYKNSIAASSPHNFTGLFAHYGAGAGVAAATTGSYYIRMGDGYGTLKSTPTQLIDTEHLTNNFFIGFALDLGAWGFSSLSFGSADLVD